MHSETPLNDGYKGLVNSDSKDSLSRKLVSLKSGDNFSIGDIPQVANELFQQSLHFEVEVDRCANLPGPWIERTEAYFKGLAEKQPTMAEEFFELCKLCKKDVIVSLEESDKVSFTKKKDFLMFRPEILDKDSELSSMALAMKNKIRKAF